MSEAKRNRRGTQDDSTGVPAGVNPRFDASGGARRYGRGSMRGGDTDGDLRAVENLPPSEGASVLREVVGAALGSFSGLGSLHLVRENHVLGLVWGLPESLRGDRVAEGALASAWLKSFSLQEEHLRGTVEYDSWEIRMKGEDWETLGKWMERFPNSPIPEEYAFAITRKLARTFDYLEKNGAFPRHLSPEAIRIEMRAAAPNASSGDAEGMYLDEETPEPLLEEFVVADAVRHLLARRNIAPAALPDEAEWTAPELKSGDRATARSCQWFLARLLYRMLKGEPPAASPQPLRKLKAGQNSAFKRALSPNPAKRFKTCSDFARMAETGKKPGPGPLKSAIVVLSAVLLAAGVVIAAWMTRKILGERPEVPKIETGPGEDVVIAEDKLSEKAETRLADAVSAKNDGRWKDCLAAAGEVVAEAPWHKQAAALVSEAQYELRPGLRIEADKPGAWVVYKGAKVRLPTSLKFKRGEKVGPLDVRAEIDGKTWSAFIAEFTVDDGWSGTRLRKVALQPGDVGSGNERKRRTVKLPNEKALTMIWCPPGTFTLGERGSGNEREVRLTKGFWLAEKEFTVGEWKSMRPRSPSSIAKWNNKLKYPVLNDVNERPLDNVTWEECQSFISELNNSGCDIDLVFRLPTEAEWEYACRAGTTGDYAGNLEELAWYEKNAKNIRVVDKNTNVAVHESLTPSPPGGKKPNPWGFFDMHGNVSEWCADQWEDGWWRRQAKGATLTDPTGPAHGGGHVVRGGNVTSSANACKSHARERAPRAENGFDTILAPMQKEDRRLVNIGFRLAADEIE